MEIQVSLSFRTFQLSISHSVNSKDVCKDGEDGSRGKNTCKNKNTAAL